MTDYSQVVLDRIRSLELSGGDGRTFAMSVDNAKQVAEICYEFGYNVRQLAGLLAGSVGQKPQYVSLQAYLRGLQSEIYHTGFSDELKRSLGPELVDALRTSGEK